MPLPEGWRDRAPCDPDAPAVSTWRSWGKVFLMRKRRVVGQDRSERLHASVPETHWARELLETEEVRPLPEAEQPG